MVWRGGDGGTFYRGWEAGGGETVGQAAAGCALSRRRLLKGEMMGWRGFMGKFKRSGWHIDSPPYGCRRASIGSGWCGGASRGWRLGLQPKEEDNLVGPGLGRVHWAQWPTGLDSVGDRKNGGGPHEGMGQNQTIRKIGLFKWFQIYLGFRIQKSKDSKYF
jgi:hypothetical protein